MAKIGVAEFIGQNPKAIARQKQHGNAASHYLLGERVDHLASEIDVENRQVQCLCACGLLGLPHSREWPHHGKSKRPQVFLEGAREKKLIFDDKYAQICSASGLYGSEGVTFERHENFTFKAGRGKLEFHLAIQVEGNGALQ